LIGDSREDGDILDQLAKPVESISKRTSRLNSNYHPDQALSLEKLSSRPISPSPINSTINQLTIFAAEVKKVAPGVSPEGKLGVQAEVRKVKGIGSVIFLVSFRYQEFIVCCLMLSLNAVDGTLTMQVLGFVQSSAAAMDATSCGSSPWRGTGRRTC